MEFTKSELDNGMVVELRNGMKFLYMYEQLVGKDIYSNLYLHYNDNLLNLSKTKLDIIKVYDVNWGDVHFLEDIFNNLIPIWEREEKEYPILTKYQYELLKHFKEEFNWIARSELGVMRFYNGINKPYKEKGYGWWQYDDDTETYCLNEYLDDFNFIKWENKEPWSIQELLENCEVEN